ARAAHHAIDEAFSIISNIHDLMSFQQPESDLSRLNRDAAKGWIEVDWQTYEVLLRAQEIAKASGGAFDVTIAGRLVERNILLRLQGTHLPDTHANWGDVELEAGKVRFSRQLLIDLSGIAKGYAVDRAIESLRHKGATQACVNAGGDLRVFGPKEERI